MWIYVDPYPKHCLSIQVVLCTYVPELWYDEDCDAGEDGEGHGQREENTATHTSHDKLIFLVSVKEPN